MRNKRLLINCFAMVAAAMVSSCSLFGSDDPQGTEVENEVGYGLVFNKGGKPAAGAEVRIVPVAYSPKTGLAKVEAGIYKLETDAKGRYSLKNIPGGAYNVQVMKDALVAFQDSVNINDGPTNLEADTLSVASSLEGFVALQPNHNPATATVQLLGTTFYANVDNRGAFKFSGLAEGRYSAAVTTTLPSYTTLYAGFVVGEARREILADTLRPTYTGIPIVTGISASYDTLNGVVRVSWHPVDYGALLGYKVFRDRAGSQNLSFAPINTTRIVDTFYLDTLFASGQPRYLQSAYGYQYGSYDTNVDWEYRVVAQAKNGDPGEIFEAATVTTPPPSAVSTVFDFEDIGAQVNKYSIRDTARVVAHFRNFGRTIQSLVWRRGNTEMRRVDLAGANEGADTLVYIATDKVEDLGLSITATDNSGKTWSATTTVHVLLDEPGSYAGPDTVCEVSQVCRMRGVGSDNLGRIVKYEWDVGATGTYVKTDSPIIDAIIPNRPGAKVPIVLRVTDDDGNQAVDTALVYARPYKIGAVRPVQPHNYVKQGIGLPLVAAGGKIYAFGGQGDFDHDTWTEYDPVADSWAFKAGPHDFGTLAEIGGRIFLVCPNSLLEYVPSTGAWNPRKKPLISGKQYSMPMLAVCAGRIYRLGQATDAEDYPTTVEEYDPTQDAWTRVAEAPVPVNGAASFHSFGGRIYLLGWGMQRKLFAFDPSANNWSSLPSRNVEGTHLIFGVVDSTLICGDVQWNQSVSMETFDLKTGSWSTGGTDPVMKEGDGVPSLQVVGGRLILAQTLYNHDNGYVIHINVAAYDLQKKIWQTLPPILSPYAYRLSTLVFDDKLVVAPFGGAYDYYSPGSMPLYIYKP